MRGFPLRWWRLAIGAAAMALPGGCSLVADLDGYTGGSSAGNEAGTTGADGSGPKGDARAPLPDVVAPDGGSAYVAAVLADKPIAYYPLEETSGTIARDVVGGQDANWIGTVKLGAAGAVGNAARLDGQTTRLELPPGLFRFPAQAHYSIEVWFSSDVVDGQVRFVFDEGSRTLEHGGYAVYFADTFFQSVRGYGDAGGDGYSDVTPPTPGKLVHVVLVYDGSHQILYANGVGNNVSNALGALEADPDALLAFGDSASGQYFKLPGRLDEIAIYDKVLAPARVQAHFDAAPK